MTIATAHIGDRVTTGTVNGVVTAITRDHVRIKWDGVDESGRYTDAGLEKYGVRKVQPPDQENRR